MKNRNYLFASYSSKDSVVKDIIQMLAEKGVEVWFDQDNMNAGHKWDDDARKAISSKYCKGILLFLSVNSITSSAVYEELSFAESNFVRMTHSGDKLQIIPIDLEEIIDDPMIWAYKVLEDLEDRKTEDENWYKKQEFLAQNTELNYFSGRTVRIKYITNVEELVNGIIRAVRDVTPSVLYEEGILSNEKLNEIVNAVEALNISGKYYDALNRLNKDNEQFNGDQRIKNLIKKQEQYVDNSKQVKIDDKNDQINLATRKWKVENNADAAADIYKLVIKEDTDRTTKYSAMRKLLDLYIEEGFVQTAFDFLIENKGCLGFGTDIESWPQYIKCLKIFLDYEATVIITQKNLEDAIINLKAQKKRIDSTHLSQYVEKNNVSYHIAKQNISKEKKHLNEMIIQCYKTLFLSYMKGDKDDKIFVVYNELRSRLKNMISAGDTKKQPIIDNITSKLIDYYCKKMRFSDAIKMLDNIYDEEIKHKLSDMLEEIDDGLSDFDEFSIPGNSNDNDRYLNNYDN